MRTQTTSRGAALILAVIGVLIVTTIGIAMLRMTYREVAGSQAGAQEQALIACAEAARVQLFSQMHVLGFQPELVPELKVTKLGTVSGSARSFAVGGHYDTPSTSSPTPGLPSPVVIEQVSYLPPYAAGPSKSIQDITNRLSAMVPPQSPVKVVAMCVDSSGRQLEVEFGVKFGM